jgi:hypothetical protein
MLPASPSPHIRKSVLVYNSNESDRQNLVVQTLTPLRKMMPKFVPKILKKKLHVDEECARACRFLVF